MEQDLLLRALVRAHVVLYGVGRSGVGPDQPIASAEEVRRWQWCDVSDRRAVSRAAFTRVTVDGDGRIHPVWRYETDPAPDPGGR